MVKKFVMRPYLLDIDKQNNIPENIVNQAWRDKHANGPADSIPASLLPYLQYAGAIQAKSVPTFIIGDEMLPGVITRKKLLAAASQVSQKNQQNG